MSKNKERTNKLLDRLRRFIGDLAAEQPSQEQLDELLLMSEYLHEYLRRWSTLNLAVIQKLLPARTAWDLLRLTPGSGIIPGLRLEILGETSKLEPGFYRGIFDVTVSPKGFTLTTVSGTRLTNIPEKS